jgi:ferredoxin
MPTVEYLNYEVLDDHDWSMDDDDLFEEAAAADLSAEDYGTLEVNQGEYILEAAEAQGYDWPFSCRAGACANCASIVKEGEIEMERSTHLHREPGRRRGQDRLQRETPRLPPEPRYLSAVAPTVPIFRRR